MKTKIITVYHPSSPGSKIKVRRSWLGRLFKPKDFATYGEVDRHWKAVAEKQKRMDELAEIVNTKYNSLKKHGGLIYELSDDYFDMIMAQAELDSVRAQEIIV